MKHFLWTVKDYTLCQGLSVYEQLKSGVRFLDLRISLYKVDKNDGKSFGQYYCSHTFLTVPFEEVVYDLYRFLSENPTETVLSIIRGDHKCLNIVEKVSFLEHNKNSLTKVLTDEDMPLVIKFIQEHFHDYGNQTQVRTEKTMRGVTLG